MLCRFPSYSCVISPRRHSLQFSGNVLCPSAGWIWPSQFPSSSDLSHYFISSSRLVELLKSAAKSEKEDKKLPSVVFDLLQVALKEGAFELFWNEVVENRLLKEKSGPVRFVLTYTVCCFPCYPSVSLPRGFDCHLLACSCTLPQHFLSFLPLCVDLLLCLSLRECFLFPLSFMCYRLLGSALPLLSLEQLQVVLKGKVMLHYGEHVVTTQVGL